MTSPNPSELGNGRMDQGGEAGWASLSAICLTKAGVAVDAIQANDWPISGDDLALAKAGVIA